MRRGRNSSAWDDVQAVLPTWISRDVERAHLLPIAKIFQSQNEDLQRARTDRTSSESFEGEKLDPAGPPDVYAVPAAAGTGRVFTRMDILRRQVFLYVSAMQRCGSAADFATRCAEAAAHEPGSVGVITVDCRDIFSKVSAAVDAVISREISEKTAGCEMMS